MDRLNMSLDQLIEKNQENKKEKFGNRNNNNGGKNRNNRSNDKPKSFGAAPRKQHQNDSDDRNAEPYVRRPVEVRQPLIYRPVKIVSSSERERIQQPHAAASSGSSSVFARLGKQPASGTYVLFSNLKKSVEGRDLEELCGSVGEVKEVEKSGTGAAKVLFARRTDAVTCVSKFNGLTLDGLVMTVALAEDAEPARPKSIFDRLAPKNVKEGVFGTAMDGSDDEQEVRHHGNGRARTASREPVFQVTLGGAANVKFSDNDHGNNHNARREPRSAHRQVESRNGGNDRRPQSAGRGGSNPRKQGGGGGRGGGGGDRAAKKDVNLDDDLDTYMASR